MRYVMKMQQSFTAKSRDRACVLHLHRQIVGARLLTMSDTLRPRECLPGLEQSNEAYRKGKVR